MEDEENIDMEEINDWKIKSEKYKRLEKDVILKLETEELDEGIRTDEDSLFSEHDESDIRKKRDINDVFEDPGFLEF